MAYTGRGNTGNRDGHGWAIAGAFAGQAAIIIGIGALLTGAGPTAAVSQASAVPVMAPPPAISVGPDLKAPTDFSYQVTMDGQSGGGVFPDTSPMPSFMVKPGQDLTIRLDMTVPPAQSVTTMRVSLIGTTSAAGASIQPLLSGTYVFPPSPGTHVFALSWPGSASELTPGTVWTLFMSAGTSSSGYGGPIATVTVAS